jgi:hypothetical protein
LQRIGRTAKDPVKLRRAIVVLMSAQRQGAPDIAHLLDCSQEYVRGWSIEAEFAALRYFALGGTDHPRLLRQSC